MEVSLICRRHKRQPLPVRRESRLQIHRAPGRHFPRPPIPRIQRPQLNCVVIVAHKRHPPLIGRPIRLIVVARTGCKLLRHRACQFLPPQRARHRVNQAAGIRRPSRRARSRSQLRQIHFPEVIRMRQINLLDHLFALRDTRDASNKKQANQTQLEQEPSTSRVARTCPERSRRAPRPRAFATERVSTPKLAPAAPITNSAKPHQPSPPESPTYSNPPASPAPRRSRFPPPP